MAKDFDRQDAEVQIRIVSQLLSHQWRSPAPHEPLHITRDARDPPHALKISGKGKSPASIRIAQKSREQAKLITLIILKMTPVAKLSTPGRHLQMNVGQSLRSTVTRLAGSMNQARLLFAIPEGLNGQSVRYLAHPSI